jgi:hypothetical protein
MSDDRPGFAHNDPKLLHNDPTQQHKRTDMKHRDPDLQHLKGIEPKEEAKVRRRTMPSLRERIELQCGKVIAAKAAARKFQQCMVPTSDEEALLVELFNIADEAEAELARLRERQAEQQAAWQSPQASKPDWRRHD